MAHDPGSRIGHNMGAWVNRKSRLGLRAIQPLPVTPGTPWWTTPPVSAPLESAILYAIEYREELIKRSQRPSHRQEAQDLLHHVNQWLVHARRLRHALRERDASADLRELLAILNGYPLRPVHRAMVAEIRERYARRHPEPYADG